MSLLQLFKIANKFQQKLGSKNLISDHPDDVAKLLSEAFQQALSSPVEGRGDASGVIIGQSSAIRFDWLIFPLKAHIQLDVMEDIQNPSEMDALIIITDDTYQTIDTLELAVGSGKFPPQYPFDMPKDIQNNPFQTIKNWINDNVSWQLLADKLIKKLSDIDSELQANPGAFDPWNPAVPKEQLNDIEQPKNETILDQPQVVNQQYGAMTPELQEDWEKKKQHALELLSRPAPKRYAKSLIILFKLASHLKAKYNF